LPERWIRFPGAVIASLHIADVSPRVAADVLLRPPDPGHVPGLTYAVTTTTAALGEPLLPPRHAGRLGLLAAWEDDAALEDFTRLHPVAERFAAGWQVRLQPLRVFGAGAGLPGLPAKPLPADPEEPVWRACPSIANRPSSASVPTPRVASGTAATRWPASARPAPLPDSAQRT
jgi:hypothetical protein